MTNNDLVVMTTTTRVLTDDDVTRRYRNALKLFGRPRVKLIIRLYKLHLCNAMCINCIKRQSA